MADINSKAGRSNLTLVPTATDEFQRRQLKSVPKFEECIKYQGKKHFGGLGPYVVGPKYGNHFDIWIDEAGIGQNPTITVSQAAFRKKLGS